MDELLQKAIQRRDRLRAELETLDRFIASYGRLRETPETPAPTLFDAPIEHDTSKHRGARTPALQELLTAAAKLILDEGRPLSRGDLVERLEQQGFTLEGRDKTKVLGTNLWRSGRFLNIKGAGYWPKGAPVPQGFASLPRRETMIP